ncbi:hypothetical protein AB0E67_22220 [Streptomyces sp. NPDC032161]|uniref:hypothetical protein n=1 Tax=unclassified Streptomyces TaxID=2593676 RepID=UPI0033E74B42
MDEDDVGPAGVVDHRRVVPGEVHVDGAVDTHGLEGLFVLADRHAGTVGADEAGDAVVGGTPRGGPDGTTRAAGRGCSTNSPCVFHESAWT